MNSRLITNVLTGAFIALAAVKSGCYLDCHPILASVSILAFAIAAARIVVWGVEQAIELLANVASPKRVSKVISQAVGLAKTAAPVVGAATVAVLAAGTMSHFVDLGTVFGLNAGSVAIGVLAILFAQPVGEAIKNLTK